VFRRSAIGIIRSLTVAVSSIVMLIGLVNNHVTTIAKAVRSDIQRREEPLDAGLDRFRIHLKLERSVKSLSVTPGTLSNPAPQLGMRGEKGFSIAYFH